MFSVSCVDPSAIAPCRTLKPILRRLRSVLKIVDMVTCRVDNRLLLNAKSQVKVSAILEMGHPAKDRSRAEVDLIG